MKIIETSLPGVLVIESNIFIDERGNFFESYNKKAFRDAGITSEFVQDNQSRSIRNVLRGLHYQIKQPQGKLIKVINGEVFDVTVDIRKCSSNFGKWEGLILSAENRRMLWIPPGFAHGFLVLSEMAELLYKTTDYWSPDYERCIVWNDPDLAINWRLTSEPILSSKDKLGSALANAELYQ